MAQIKVKAQAKTISWNAQRRYRVGDTVKHLGSDWTNTSGGNSEPLPDSNDWVKADNVPKNVVLTIVQTLGDVEQAQARENIDTPANSEVLNNTNTPNEVAMKDNSGKTLQVGKEGDDGVTAYATTAELIAAGYTAANGYYQFSEVIMQNTGDYTRYEKQSDDDNNWRVWKDSTDTWTPLPLV